MNKPQQNEPIPEKTAANPHAGVIASPVQNEFSIGMKVHNNILIRQLHETESWYVQIFTHSVKLRDVISTGEL